MRTSSAKAKGRRLCVEIRDNLLTREPDLKPDDIFVTSSGAPGKDLRMSPRAKLRYPFVFECKCQESLSIWEALKQAESHANGEDEGCAPLLVFRRNHSKTYVALEFDCFLDLVT